MTTQYKITRSDLTADASQNRESDASRIIREALITKPPTPAKPAHTPEPIITAGGFHHVDCQCQGCMKLRFNEAKANHEKALNLASYISEGLVNTQCELSETAAERDRLKRDIAYLRETKDQWVRQCDQAREQVKTLLAACKKGMELQGPGDIWSVDPGKMDAFKRAAQAAIASAESEGQ